jgi:magnesium transporter
MPFEFTNGIEQLKKLIEEKNSEEIIRLMKELHPADIAELMEDLNTEQAKFVFMLLDGEKTSDVLVEIPKATENGFLKNYWLPWQLH